MNGPPDATSVENPGREPVSPALHDQRSKSRKPQIHRKEERRRCRIRSDKLAMAGRLLQPRLTRASSSRLRCKVQHQDNNLLFATTDS